MSFAKTRILLNPKAGSATGVAKLEAAVRQLLPGATIVLAGDGVSIEALATATADDGCDTIIAAGGDGTLNGVLNGLGSHLGTIRLGLLPLGTGNDFARSAYIPTDVDHALAVIREGATKKLDVLRVMVAGRTRLMLNVSAGGFSTKVSEKATCDVKDTWGSFCYARSVVEALPELGDYHTCIYIDDRETITTPVYNVTVANGRYVAGGIPIAPDALLDDGLADLVVLPVASVRELAILAPATMLGKHLESDRLLFRRASKIEIQSQPAMRFNTDGELLPEGTVIFEVLPRVLNFIVGPQPRPA